MAGGSTSPDLLTLKKMLLDSHNNNNTNSNNAAELSPRLRGYVENNKLSLLIKLQACIRRWLCRTSFLKKKKQKWRRELVAKEFLTTEKTYVENLSTLTTTFLSPLLSASAPEEVAAVAREALSELQHDLSIISSYNTHLLRDLSSRVDTPLWSPITSKLGDIFLKMGSFLKTYTQYATHYQKAMVKLEELYSIQKCSAYLEELRKNGNTGNLYLRDYLIMPIQRIPRYQLLLRDLVESTWSDHPDYADLKSAMSKIVEVATWINQAQEVSLSMEKVITINTMLTGKLAEGLELVQPSRKYVREAATIEYVANGFNKSRHIFLFNDLIVFTKRASSKNTFEVTRIIPMDSVTTVKEVKIKGKNVLCLLSKEMAVFLMFSDDDESDPNNNSSNNNNTTSSSSSNSSNSSNSNSNEVSKWNNEISKLVSQAKEKPFSSSSSSPSPPSPSPSPSPPSSSSSSTSPSPSSSSSSSALGRSGSSHHVASKNLKGGSWMKRNPVSSASSDKIIPPSTASAPSSPSLIAANSQLTSASPRAAVTPRVSASPRSSTLPPKLRPASSLTPSTPPLIPSTSATAAVTTGYLSSPTLSVTTNPPGYFPRPGAAGAGAGLDEDDDIPLFAPSVSIATPSGKSKDDNKEKKPSKDKSKRLSLNLSHSFQLDKNSRSESKKT